jgi:hypothetical protein
LEFVAFRMSELQLDEITVHLSSFRQVEAIVRKPSQVTSWPEYPFDEEQRLWRFPDIGLSSATETRSAHGPPEAALKIAEDCDA